MERASKIAAWMLACLLTAVSACSAQPPAEDPPNFAEDNPNAPDAEAAKQKMGEPTGAKKIAKDFDVWIDAEKKLVIVDGKICLRRGTLEMFACTKGSKEHESVVSANCKAFMVHAALLAIGAKQGSPVKFDPVYEPAKGTEVEITVLWIDKEGKKQKVRAQEWVRDHKTKKQMTHPWVFAGSGFWVDEETKEKHYLADGGDLICVSNFPSAMLDLPIESTQADEGRLFEANLEKIPPVGTNVRLILRPVEKKGAEKAVETKKE